ncbi:MAG: MtrB/PioB family decaheme-associated outer membrane protein [Elusimicrobia bacterium]|nr:MtrB/PioB family decaheme-associated outer membrane protein [Elusimicrobiota bacterium]
MKLLKFGICMALLAAVSSGLQAGIFDKTTGDADAGVSIHFGDDDNFKYNEYSYKTDTALRPFAGANVLALNNEDDHFLKADFAVKYKEDLDLKLETGHYGLYKFDLGFSRMGHNFAFGAKTLYSGIGTGELVIDDAVQTDLQGAASATNLVTRLTPYMDSAGKIDLALKRDTMKTNFVWQSLAPLTLSLDAMHEWRKGTRPFSGTFGFGNAIEIPEPIDYFTNNIRFNAEYAGKPLYASLTYERSVFDNDITTLRYDNPFRITDTTNSRAYAQNYAGGPKTGLSALPPDNTYDNVSALVAKNLPWHSRMSAQVSYGVMKQNDQLPPVTVNTAIAGYPLALPAESPDAKINKGFYQLSLVSRPIQKLHLKAGYKYNQHKNKTDIRSVAAYVRMDAVIEGDSTPSYVSYIKRTGELEASYDLGGKDTLSAAYENEGAAFDQGSAKSEDANIYKLSWNSRRLDWLTGRLSLEHENKNSDYPDYTSANAELPWTRKYYAASKKTNGISAMTTIVPTDDLAVNLEYKYGKDDYNKSLFGLREGNQHIAGVDADYHLTENISLNAFFTYELRDTDQQSRQWVPSSTGSPYVPAYASVENLSNWTLKIKDAAYTPGLGITVKDLVKEGLDLEAEGSLTKASGKADYDSAKGTAGVDDNNAFDPQDFGELDDTTLISFASRLNYKLDDTWNFFLGYQYERWKIKDFVYDGYADIAVTGAGAYNSLLTMNTLPRDYAVHALYLKAAYRF